MVFLGPRFETLIRESGLLAKALPEARIAMSDKIPAANFIK